MPPPTCGSCKHTFANDDKLRKHIQSIHPNEHHISCSICGQKYALQQGALRDECEKACADIDIKTDTKPNVYLICNYPGCLMRYREDEQLGRHRNLAHKEKVIECEVENCTQKFGRLGDMKSHAKVHSNTTHKCPTRLCPRVFKTEIGLKEHMIIHGPTYKAPRQLSTSPIVCQICTERNGAVKTIKGKIGFNKHVNRFHNNVNIEDDSNDKIDLPGPSRFTTTNA